MIAIQDKNIWQSCWVRSIVFSLLIITCLHAFPKSAWTKLNYGQAYPDIGTFQTPSGRSSLWLGWDANFSETYTPEGESYAWVVYFAPEAIYLALQSSKSVYSGVNVNAGFNYFYGSLNISTGDRLSANIIDDLASVGLSRNLFSASTPGIGVGPFSVGNLSFALSAGLTFLKEKSTDTLKRGIQVNSGLSVSYDLVSIPLPFSVSLGTDCVDGDPPELCRFVGFYPILIYDLEQSEPRNPIDLLLSELAKTALSPPLSSVDGTKKILLKAVQIMRTDTKFNEFIESQLQNSNYDTLIGETQQWLQNGDTNNLPENLELPDPEETHRKMKPIFAAAQMAFELGYQRGCVANPNCGTKYADCVIEEYCKPGEECIVDITAKEIAALIPGKNAADFEEAWLRIDNPVEQYLVSETESTEWLQILNGKARYIFLQNSDTPVVLGVRIDPANAPVDTGVELCRRMIYFTLPDGDINGDKVVDLKDSILGLQILTNTEPLSPTDIGVDINYDGRIGIEEVVYSLQKLSGLL